MSELDELEFLRGVEQDVQLTRSYLPHFSPVTASNLLTALMCKLNDRIITLLKSPEPQRPCNEMGGGSAGLDTAGDFAMHCDKPDRHDGLHSYEEE